MSSVGVIEVLIALRMQINTPFCLPSSSQQRPVTPETLAANRRAVDFFVIPGGGGGGGFAVNRCSSKWEMAVLGSPWLKGS